MRKVQLVSECIKYGILHVPQTFVENNEIKTQ